MQLAKRSWSVWWASDVRCWMWPGLLSNCDVPQAVTALCVAVELGGFRTIPILWLQWLLFKREHEMWSPSVSFIVCIVWSILRPMTTCRLDQISLLPASLLKVMKNVNNKTLLKLLADTHKLVQCKKRIHWNPKLEKGKVVPVLN